VERRREKPLDTLSQELHALLAEYSFSPIGREAQLELAWVLEKQGFAVECEVQVPGYRRLRSEGEKRGKIGRIDLLAVRGATRVGIEIDSWRVPKTKSVLKLLAFSGLTHRAVLLNHAPGLWDAPVRLPAAVSHRRGDLDLLAHLDVQVSADPDVVSGHPTAWCSAR
jgi:hypothetical protein